MTTIEKDIADGVKFFRKALMEAHADDWTMETIAAAAHVCARAVVEREWYPMPRTDADLAHMLPDAAIEAVGEREELVIYTGWSADDDGNLVPMPEHLD